MTKRKETDGESVAENNTIPIPIQTFLWRQSSPFIREKLGKLCEASSVSFERVLVQNILHGLSPSLCAAVQSMSRWRLVQAAFPHVIHCCAAILRQRQPDSPLGGAAVKLLYTLHWLVLDAASECDDDSDNGTTYLYALDAVELFVYMLAPLVNSVRSSDFHSLKLENGLRMWHPLWSHRQPDVACFSTPVQTSRAPPHTARPRVNFNMADVYIGRGMSTEDFTAVENDNTSEVESAHAPLARLSDICALSTTDTTTSVEIICELCNTSVDAGCTCGAAPTKGISVAASTVQIPECHSPVDREYVHESLANSMGGLEATDVLSASYFDVAVLRCLFYPRWHEDGVLWALRYLHVRLLEVKSCDEYQETIGRQHSRSLPFLVGKKTGKRSRVAQLKRTSRQIDDDDSGDDDRSDSSSSEVARHRRGSLRHPTITVTGDTPTRAITPDWSRQLHSATSVQPAKPLRRTSSDSCIKYSVTEPTDEVAGSIFYIRSNGQLDYEVVLQAVAGVAARVSSLHATAVLLNVVNCLLDLGVTKGSTMQATWAKGTRRTKRLKSCHHMAMDTVIRIFRILGCQHGCGDSYRGSKGDYLREQARDLFARLMNTNRASFSNYLSSTFINLPLAQVIDFLHTFLNYCNEPAPFPYSTGTRQSSVDENENGYINNFGQAVGGTPSVENELISITLKQLVTKFVEARKELMNPEKLNLYCEVRQLLNYVRESHGGTFRCVALSGLMQSLHTTTVEKENPKTKVIRRNMSMTSDSGDENDLRMSLSASEDVGTNGKSKKSIFKRRSKRHGPSSCGVASDSEMLDEWRNGRLSPKVSLSGAEDESFSGRSTPHRKFSKFNITWRKSAKSDHEEELSANELADCKSEKHPGDVMAGVGRVKGRMSFKAASQATMTFLSARKRIEGGLKNWNKRKCSKRESIYDAEGFRLGTHHIKSSANPQVTIMREKKLVDSYAVKSGMLRFSLLLDCCPPGSVPDPNLLAAMLDLEAPVVARAALLLECAHFVSRCNRGDWPRWMKLNLPGVRTGVRGHAGHRRVLQLQCAAGRMFHQWAEAIGNRMQDLLWQQTADDRFSIIEQVKEDSKKKELKMDDDEEDFMDEATVNASGSESPYALMMVATHLLLEITTFLRETFQYLPKVKQTSATRNLHPAERPSSRRWSSVVSSGGQSDRSNSRSSQGDNAHLLGSPSERKISFAVYEHNERSDSVHSSTTTISQEPSTDGKPTTGRYMTGQKKLLRTRKGSGHGTSFRRSFKLNRSEDDSSKRTSSIKSRKVSMQSLQSVRIDETDGDEGTLTVEDVQSPASSHDYTDKDDHDYCSHLPWVKAVVQLANTSNFICTHQSFCHPNCYERQRRSCIRLMTAVHKMYECDDTHNTKTSVQTEKMKDASSERLRPRNSVLSGDRRESTPLLDKIKLSEANVAKIVSAMEKLSEGRRPQYKKQTYSSAISKYIKVQVQGLMQCPMSLISKAAPVLSDDVFTDMMPVAWELLLSSDQELAAAAATVFIISSVKSSECSLGLIKREMGHTDVNQRIDAVLRFGVLWRSRWQVWPRMEDGAHVFFKLPPPSIDFVLPSPTIGLPSLNVVDPPWCPHYKTKVEEVTINQDETKSFMTATSTRRKQQQEMIHRALLAEEERRRAARQDFHITSVAVCQLAAYEPALHHVSEDHEEGEEDRVEHLHSHHMQLAQHFFPSSICAAVVPLIHLMEDLEVTADGIAVSEVADKVVFSCLNEEPALFFRTFLEKLTHKDKQDELGFLLRKLLHRVTELPAQTAHCLFNYLVGFIMFYVRSPTEGGQEAIGNALSMIHQIVPSVKGIHFKDLKQTLRKEQCDPMLLITANVPSAKKLLVHGPDLSSIPSQLPINEDTQFSHILQDSLEFFNIPLEEHGNYFLADLKTYQMHSLNSYVRDFYMFRRNCYPQLSLVHVNPDDVFRALQKQALGLKMVEIGKVFFVLSLLHSSSKQQLANHVSFLQEELLKLPTFPRKAIEADFGLQHGKYGKEVKGLDMLHKYMWTKLISDILRGMSSTVTWSADLNLLLSVVNGTLVLHSEDMALLNLTGATYINAALHFKQVFATDGFLFIIPTVLRVYSTHLANKLVCQAIQFICRQFFLLHRNPFVLQMFGSVAPILDLSEDHSGIDHNKVLPQALFKLLLALGSDQEDNVHILELVESDIPLQPLDFCYIDDPPTFTLTDAINMCVTVVAYDCDSIRGRQMLTILEAILPYYLHHLEAETGRSDDISQAVRDEINIISNIAVAVRALISSCESLLRNFSGPQRHLESVNTNKKSCQNHSNHSPPVPSIFFDEPSDTRYRHLEEGLSRHRCTPPEGDTEFHLSTFRHPRNSLLSIVADFYSHSTARLKQLRKMLADPSFRNPELLDTKAHNRLAEIAHTLLKVAPYDPNTMKCVGLQRYMLDMLPITDWSLESARPALNLISRRLERLFSKIYKKPVLRRHLHWPSAANLLKGVCETLMKFNYIAYLPHLKTLISVCLHIILADDVGTESHHGDNTVMSRAPPAFCSAVIKLTAIQMYALGDTYLLEHICGGTAMFTNYESATTKLINLILPLCIRTGCGRRDCARLSMADIEFTVTILLHTLIPPSKDVPGGLGVSKMMSSISDGISSSGRASSFRSAKVMCSDEMQNIALLGLKIVMVCFEKQLSSKWPCIAACIREIGHRQQGGIPLWRFIDFVVTIRNPLFILLQPFIRYKMLHHICETEAEYFLQQMIQQKLSGTHIPRPRCKATALLQLATELQHLRQGTRTVSESLPRAGTMPSSSSLSQHKRDMECRRQTIARTSSIHELLEQHISSRLHDFTTALPSRLLSPKVNSAASIGVTTVDSNTGTLSGNMANQPEITAENRKSSHRITAREGSLILNKFLTQSTAQEDEELSKPPSLRSIMAVSLSTVGADLCTFPRKLHRQGSIYERAGTAYTFTKMHTVSSVPQHSTLHECADDDTHVSHDRWPAGVVTTESESQLHRLQRQDAKSRKTFKIKRQRTTMRSHHGVMRSATVRASSANTPLGCIPRRMQPSVEEEEVDTSQMRETDQQDTHPQAGSMRTDNSKHTCTPAPHVTLNGDGHDSHDNHKQTYMLPDGRRSASPDESDSLLVHQVASQEAEREPLMCRRDTAHMDSAVAHILLAGVHDHCDMSGLEKLQDTRV